MTNETDRTERWPFEPPYTATDLPQLDRLHSLVGLGPEWLASERRAEIARETD